ncbi:MAG: glycerol dehydrogenase [Planctomycetes bacterium]|nr:glycerol dehydrogenase [Planctomycetota bacterium]
MLSVFSSPGRYTQGKNATAALGQEMVRVGLLGPALIVAGQSATRLLSETWAKSLGEAKIVHSIHPFGGECSLHEVDEVVASAKRIKAQVIIGAGGGKVLDTARAAADALDLPVVNCPTVASTDAPCSALSVIYTDDGIFQEYRFYRKNPDLVLVDTQVIAQSPPRTFVAGMGDALSTYFEARTCVAACKSNMRGGGSTLSALALAELCYRTVLAEGVLANTLLSGLGFESSGLAAAHAVHNGLTAAAGTHDFMHGEKVAFGTLVQLILEGRPQAEVDELIGFCLSVGLPVTLAEIGLTNLEPALLRRIAEVATAPGETIHNEPFVVTPDRLADAIVAADCLGKHAKSKNYSHGWSTDETRIKQEGASQK